jgi:tRNA(adenine34) deaminase
MMAHPQRRSTPAGDRATDEKWMRQALRLGEAAAAVDEVPVGAIVVCDGVAIGEGYNRSIADVDPSAHAEVVALRAAARLRNNYRLARATLYVTLEPCAMCSGAMLHARIERLVFGAFDPNSGAAGSVIDVLDQPRFNHRIEVRGGILELECADQLRAFFRQRR